MKLMYRGFSDPHREFLFGIYLMDGLAENNDTGDQTEISMLSFGFLLFEVSIIW